MWFEYARCFVYIILTNNNNNNKRTNSFNNSGIKNRVIPAWHRYISDRKALGPIYEGEPFLGIDHCPDCRMLMKHCSCLCERFEPQSGTTNDNIISMVDNDTTRENVTFIDQHSPYKYDVESIIDPTRKVNDTNDAELANFFSRVVKIGTFEWSTSVSLYESLNPWELFFKNKRVANRISNFNLARAKLHLSIKVNGNAFHYGRAIASYHPYFDSEFDNMTTNASFVPEDIVQASQCPKVYLNPTTSTGGDMGLPFFWHFNYMSIVEGDWDKMGTLIIRHINQLKHANGAADVATITVYAWATDVQLSVLTSNEPYNLTPQSGFEVQSGEIETAASTGMVSGPATAIAKMAGALKSIPAIAPFATATQVIANATSSVAQMFGYSRPPNIKDAEPYKPVTISSLALTNVPDTVQKMTVDSKQELTIDPRIAGLNGTDTMSICEIAKRESFLTKFVWNVSAPPDTLLWNSRVSPVLWAENALTPKGLHIPAMAMAALPFKYWTGTINFRFQIVCSKYHKGRLRLVYDPNYIVNNTLEEYNINYSHVIDITDKTDFTISIGNGQDRTMLEHLIPGRDSVTQAYSTSRYTYSEPGNGVIGVAVANELTIPNSTVNNDIEINVFVSAGDDFEVFVPNSEDTLRKYVFAPQSGEEENENCEELNAPQQENSDWLGPGLLTENAINKVYTGESIASFRTLLKRYEPHSAFGGGGSGDKYMRSSRSMFPFYRGNVPGAVYNNTNNKSYNYCNTLLMHWVTAAHSGWRGSIRRKILHLHGNCNILGTVTREEVGTKRYSEFYATTPSFGGTVPNRLAAYRLFDRNFLSEGSRGLCYINSRVNPNLEFESPYYHHYRFTPGKYNNWTDDFKLAEGFTLNYHLDAKNANEFLVEHVAAGEDFQTFFFTGLPRIYYESNVPTLFEFEPPIETDPPVVVPNPTPVIPEDPELPIVA